MLGPSTIKGVLFNGTIGTEHCSLKGKPGCCNNDQNVLMGIYCYIIN